MTLYLVETRIAVAEKADRTAYDVLVNDQLIIN